MCSHIYIVCVCACNTFLYTQKSALQEGQIAHHYILEASGHVKTEF